MTQTIEEKREEYEIAIADFNDTPKECDDMGRHFREDRESAEKSAYWFGRELGIPRAQTERRLSYCDCKRCAA